MALRFPSQLCFVAFVDQCFQLELPGRHFVGQADHPGNDAFFDIFDRFVELVEGVGEFNKFLDGVVFGMLLVVLCKFFLPAAILASSSGVGPPSSNHFCR